MSYYNASNVKVMLDGQPLAASAVSVNVSPELSPAYVEDLRGSHKDVPAAGVKGNLSIQYYLSEKDFVRDLFIKEDLISAEVGGLTLQSGVLSLYPI